MSESHWELITSSTLHYQQALLQEIHTFINVSKPTKKTTLNMPYYFPTVRVRGVSVKWRQIYVKILRRKRHTNWHTGCEEDLVAHDETYHSALNGNHHYRVGLQGLGGLPGYFITANYPSFLPISVIKLYYTEKQQQIF